MLWRMAVEKTLTLDLNLATWGDLRKLVSEADDMDIADGKLVEYETDPSDPDGQITGIVARGTVDCAITTAPPHLVGAAR